MMLTYSYIFQVEEKTACKMKIKLSISHLKHKLLPEKAVLKKRATRTKTMTLKD